MAICKFYLVAVLGLSRDCRGGVVVSGARKWLDGVAKYKGSNSRHIKAPVPSSPVPFHWWALSIQERVGGSPVQGAMARRFLLFLAKRTKVSPW